MSKKKLTIYCSIVLVFVILFGLYVWSVLGSTDSMNEQRLQESTRVVEQQVQKNLQYESKDLSLSIIEYGLAKQTQLDALVETVQKTVNQEGEYYVLDASGVLHSKDNPRHGSKIDLGALKAARMSGYAAVSVPDITGGDVFVGIITPFGENSPYFLAKLISADRFLEIIAADLPIETENLILFDEWGGPLGAMTETADAAVQERVQTGAFDYTSNRMTNAHQKVGLNGDYCLYIAIDQPGGWFLGTKMAYHEQGITFFGLNISTMIVFLLLVFLLIAIVLLDVFNDHEKKKEVVLANMLDGLTGLTSSTGMSEAIEQAFDKASPRGSSFVCMDIVSFSRINTMFGYATGDKLLCIIAEAIKNNQTCGIRVNADCFAFLTRTSQDAIAQFEERLHQEISTQLGSEYLQMISFKFGVYQIEDAQVSFRDVYEGALLALKDAKRQAMSNVVYFDETLKDSTELQKNIEVNMMHALSREEFVVYIQPQFDMPGEKCTRGETLIRWNSEFMGFLPPDRFIPVFERNGFIVETDFFMLTSALEFQKARMLAGKPLITLAVNQSKVTVVFPNYYERLKAMVSRYDVPLSSIELEITESTLENSWETIVPLIHSIKKLGFSIAMDDFGSGFSSLNTLRILPIDVLKIDRAFLQEADASARCRIIIKNVIHMAKELSISVVCEGVETEEQLAFLKQIGCDIVQGYYYSKPIPQEDFEKKYCDVEMVSV